MNWSVFSNKTNFQWLLFAQFYLIIPPSWEKRCKPLIYSKALSCWKNMYETCDYMFAFCFFFFFLMWLLNLLLRTAHHFMFFECEFNSRSVPKKRKKGERHMHNAELIKRSKCWNHIMQVNLVWLFSFFSNSFSSMVFCLLKSRRYYYCRTNLLIIQRGLLMWLGSRMSTCRRKFV